MSCHRSSGFGLIARETYYATATVGAPDPLPGNSFDFQYHPSTLPVLASRQTPPAPTSDNFMPPDYSLHETGLHLAGFTCARNPSGKDRPFPSNPSAQLRGSTAPFAPSLEWTRPRETLAIHRSPAPRRRRKIAPTGVPRLDVRFRMPVACVDSPGICGPCLLPYCHAGVATPGGRCLLRRRAGHFVGPFPVGSG